MIRILERSEGAVIGVQASDKLTAKDYEDVWIPELEAAIGSHGRIRALLYLDETFTGWEVGALWEDTVFGVTHYDKFEKIAVVGAGEWLEWLTKAAGGLIDADVKTFDGDELERAWEWIR